MPFCHAKTPFALLCALLLVTPVQQAAEPETAKQERPPIKVALDTDLHAGKAKHASKEPNPCEGQLEGEYMGSDVCADCHADKTQTMAMSPHGQAADPRTPFGKEGCETCHGPGELHFQTEGNCIISMNGRFGESIEQRNAICLGCHQGGSQIHWFSSIHEAEGVGCVSCHYIHQPNDVTDRATQSQVCYKCHKDIRAATYRAYTHPIRENKVICSDCHNAHGSTGPSSLKQYTINENCYACHADKRGPFLWEHNPASEDCTLCHRVHGSNHVALLNRPGPQLCQQCHAAEAAGGGRSHISSFYDFDTTNPRQMRFVVAKNCANCHIKVHGSNHPSGAALQR